MLNQSSEVYHLYNDESLELFLDNMFDGNVDFRDKIEDLDNFKLQLKRQNLYTRELEEFIENYLKFDNE